MIKIQFPDDLISLSLYNIFSYRKNDRKFIKSVKDWNKKIVMHVEPFYPVTVIFEGTDIRFEMGELEGADMKVKIEINTMLDLAYGREDPFSAMGEGKIVMEGLGSDSSLIVKFYNVFMDSMMIVAKDPQLHYYEVIEGAR